MSEQQSSASDKAGWRPIETAPKNRPILVNDTVSEFTWTTAVWLEDPNWSGWVYEAELIQECFPEGPEPTHWYDVPPLPEGI